MIRSIFMPMTQDGARVLLARNAGGFHLGGCPRPADLAETIVTACNAHASLVDAVRSAARAAVAYECGERVDLVLLAAEMHAALAAAGESL